MMCILPLYADRKFDVSIKDNLTLPFVLLITSNIDYSSAQRREIVRLALDSYLMLDPTHLVRGILTIG